MENSPSENRDLPHAEFSAIARQAGLSLEGDALSAYHDVYRRFVIPMLARLRKNRPLEDEFRLAELNLR
jgi:hypothetical protein